MPSRTTRIMNDQLLQRQLEQFIFAGAAYLQVDYCLHKAQKFRKSMLKLLTAISRSAALLIAASVRATWSKPDCAAVVKELRFSGINRTVPMMMRLDLQERQFAAAIRPRRRRASKVTP